MDTSTGRIYQGDDSALKAIMQGETKRERLVGIPDEHVPLVMGMSRKERREWYRKNKKRLNLPPWGS